jgi:hypothetical protein
MNITPQRGQNKGIVPKCEHLHIRDWMEMIDVLEDLK